MKRGIRENILMVILGITLILNIIICNIVPPVIKELVVLGYVIFGIGVLFYVLSLSSLIRKGTRNIIDSGIYGIVRHPMYLGGMIMFFSHIFIGQNWIVVISTVVAIICCYLIIQSEEKKNLEKLDNEYEDYKKKVPKLNFLLDIIK